jgi:hypothetical protein
MRLAVTQGWLECGAQLLSTAAAWLDAFGTIIGQTDRAEHDRSIVATHVQLGDKVFAVAWSPANQCCWSRFLPNSSLLVRRLRAMRCP